MTAVVIVGDAFAKPMLRALDEKGYEAPSLKTIVSSGVMWSTEVKEGLLKHLDVTLYDGLGSTEGSMGTTISTRAGVGTTAKFTTNPSVKVVTEDGRIVEPGSDEIGMVAALSASLGYFKDPEKSARTFMVIDGVPHSLPGDWAKVAADGSLILLGRGSNCINTGGEKVFPEEVEEAVKANPAVYDCLVVGVPDERFGERIVAVASLQPDATADEASIIEGATEHIARYKLPKSVHHRRPRAAGSQRQGRLPVGERGREDRGSGACMTTIDLDRAAADLRDDGLCIVPGALDADTLATARAALYEAAARDRAEGREVKFALDYPTDSTNQRVWNLPNRHPVFCALAEHPAALALVKGTLGWPASAVEHQRQHHWPGRRRDGAARRSALHAAAVVRGAGHQRAVVPRRLHRRERGDPVRSRQPRSQPRTRR